MMAITIVAQKKTGTVILITEGNEGTGFTRDISAIDLAVAVVVETARTTLVIELEQTTGLPQGTTPGIVAVDVVIAFIVDLVSTQATMDAQDPKR